MEVMNTRIFGEGSRPRDPLIPKPRTFVAADENTTLGSHTPSRRAGTRALPVLRPAVEMGFGFFLVIVASYLRRPVTVA